ncbi:MAG: hotdog domain-containing protein [Rhodospirillales bacterium]|nr:hotdog domain-containing protein [Rhodospirillales bacterium]
MRAPKIGENATQTFDTSYDHTAEASGNPGVVVVSTWSLVVWLEVVAESIIRGNYEDGEMSVGAAVCVRHLAPSPVGRPVVITATVTGTRRNIVDFDVEVRDGEKVLMTGTHTRAVIDLEAFLDQLKD